MHRHQHIALLAMRLLSHCRGSRGFTLVEMMVTVAIGSVLMLVAVPGLVEYRKNAQLSDAVSNLILASGTAKSAALKSGRNAFVAVNDTATGWTSGWYVFVDNNWNNTYDVASDEVVIRHDALPADIAATAAGTTAFSAGYLMFNGSGFPKTKAGGVGNGTLVLATTVRSSSIVVDTAGRVRSCKTGSTGCSAV